MNRTLFDPKNLLNLDRENPTPGSSIGVGRSILDWVTGSSTVKNVPATSAIENFGVTGEAQNQHVRVQGDSSRKVGETPAPPGRPEDGPLPAMQPPSGTEFKARLLARARWPDSKRVEDRRGPDPRATMTVEEWVDNHSEWRKPGR